MKVVNLVVTCLYAIVLYVVTQHQANKIHVNDTEIILFVAVSRVIVVVIAILVIRSA